MNWFREKFSWAFTLIVTTIMGILVVLCSYWLIFAHPLTKPLPDRQVAYAADYSRDSQVFFFKPLGYGVISEALRDSEQIESQKDAYRNRDEQADERDENPHLTPTVHGTPAELFPTVTRTNEPVEDIEDPFATATPTLIPSEPTSTSTNVWMPSATWYPTLEPTKFATKTSRPNPGITDTPQPTAVPPTSTSPPPTNTPRPADPYPLPSAYP